MSAKKYWIGYRISICRKDIGGFTEKILEEGRTITSPSWEITLFYSLFSMLIFNHKKKTNKIWFKYQLVHVKHFCFTCSQLKALRMLWLYKPHEVCGPISFIWSILEIFLGWKILIQTLSFWAFGTSCKQYSIRVSIDLKWINLINNRFHSATPSSKFNLWIPGKS